MFKESLKKFKSIEVESTFGNNYANSLLVMLNYINFTVKACRDKEVKEMLKKDFIKYEEILENVLSK